MTFAIITGCSHTFGVGLDRSECYVSLLEQHYKFTINNHGVPSGSCNDVLTSIVDAIKNNNRPKFIVAQWPNVFRRICWINNKKQLQNINSCDNSFQMLLKNGEENFYEPWIQSVIIANLLCKLAQIPLVNIMLENIDQQYLDRLQKENITLHTDEKLPGRTWLFDNGANDGHHHSFKCHKQWTKRLIEIIDEYTTR